MLQDINMLMILKLQTNPTVNSVEDSDLYLTAELWHLGLVVLKHRKAAKAWSLRLEVLY